MAPVEAPQTLDEAIGFAVRYVEIEVGLEKLGADADESIAKIKAVHDATAEPLKRELELLVARLRNWWAVVSDTLTLGKRKSYELAGVKMGMRLTPPKLGCTGVKKDDLAAAKLVEAKLHQFVRITIAPDKPAIIAALAAPRPGDERSDEEKAAAAEIAARLRALGFTATQKEEFFVDRGDKPAAETIAEPQQEAA